MYDKKRPQSGKRSKVHLVLDMLRDVPAVLARTIDSVRRLRGPKRRPRVSASAVTGGGREGPHVCILSRKDLRNITRVPRMAKALCDAGFRVTVVSLKPPVQELQEATPDVRYIALPVQPATVIAYSQSLRQLVNQWRQAENARKAALEKSGHRLIPRLRRCMTWPLRAFLGGVREIFVVLPSAFLLKTGEEAFRAKLKELRALHLLEIARLYVLSLRQIDSSYQFGNAVLDALRNEDVSVVQAHDNYALVASDMLAAAKNAPIVSDAVELSEHRLALKLSRLERLRERYERWEEGRIMGRCARWITVSDGLANWYQKRFKVDRPLVVRNCRYFWSCQEDRRLREDCGLKGDERLVVWFGGAYPQQGLTLLVDAASRLPEHVHIAIVAYALPSWVSYVESLSERAGQAGTGARVHVLPAREPNDLIPYASGADVGIIPRPSEYLNNYYSMPNKFLEMVMARLPIVVSQVGDMVDLMNHYDIGEVFDETRIESLVEVVARVLEPGRHARLKANVEEAAKELNWERESRPYVQMMDELTGRDGISRSSSDSVPVVAAAVE